MEGNYDWKDKDKDSDGDADGDGDADDNDNDNDDDNGNYNDDDDADADEIIYEGNDHGIVFVSTSVSHLYIYLKYIYFMKHIQNTSLRWRRIWWWIRHGFGIMAMVMVYSYDYGLWFTVYGLFMVYGS